MPSPLQQTTGGLPVRRDGAWSRLSELIDEEFLISIGWDRATQVVTLPPHHPRLGYSICPVPDCSAVASMSVGGLCSNCFQRWRSEEETSDLATFVSQPRTFFAQQRRTEPARLDLSGYSPLLRDQLLAVITLQRDAGRTQLAVLLRHMFNFIDRNNFTTLDDPKFLENSRRNAGGIDDFRRTTYEQLQIALTRPEDEKNKDVWDLRVFGYKNRHLSFTGGGRRRGTDLVSPPLTQPWLRETTKEFVYQALLPRQLSTSTIGSYLRAVGHLSATLAARPDGGDDITALGRADLVDHLIRLNAMARSGAMSNNDHHRYYVFTRRFLQEVGALQLNRPGGPAEGLSPEFALRQSDTVKRIRTLREDDLAGEALPEVVVEQLLSPQALAYVETYGSAGEQSRRLIQVVADVGRRPTEVVHLRWDCVTHEETVDELGEPHRTAVLIYDMPKTRWKGRRLPIHASTAEIIYEQQRYVRERFPNTPAADLVLWPAPFLNPEGRKPMSQGYLGKILTRWMEALPELYGPDIGADGQPVPFDRSRVVAYVFRHTFAQRHADAGTPVEVLKELMGHEVINSTQGYFQVSAKRKREAVQRVAPFQVNRDGIRTRPALTTLLPSEHARESIGALSIPFGVCVEPTNVKSHGRSCSFRYQCLGCSHFRTDPSYLPELRTYLSRRLADLEKLRAGTDEVTAWAADAATPRDEEIEAARNLIRTCEQELQDMPAAERSQVDEAIRQMRRARGDLEEVLPPSATSRVRQPEPVLFPTIGLRTTSLGQP